MEVQDFNKHDDLIAGYLKGELNPEEKEKLKGWLLENPSNKRYYDEFCELWIASRASSGNSGYDSERGFTEFVRRIEHRRKVLVPDFTVIMRYAAIFVIAFGLGSLVFFNRGRKEKAIFSEEVSVPLGSHASVTLPDGSIVTLNAGSTLKFENRSDQRIASLEGEGYFKVAKDTRRPFTVTTGFMNVVATGTEFNVKSYPSDSIIEATLISGSVRIENLSGGISKPTVLKPNQKFTYYKEHVYLDEEDRTIHTDKEQINTARVSSPQKAMGLIKEIADIEPVVSWKDNRLIFDGEPLLNIAVELERKYDVEILFDSERLKSFRFTGIIVNEPIEQVLEVMSASAPIAYRLKGRIVTLTENKKFEEINRKLYNSNK